MLRALLPPPPPPLLLLLVVVAAALPARAGGRSSPPPGLDEVDEHFASGAADGVLRVPPLTLRWHFVSADGDGGGDGDAPLNAINMSVTLPHVAWVGVGWRRLDAGDGGDAHDGADFAVLSWPNGGANDSAVLDYVGVGAHAAPQLDTARGGANDVLDWGFTGDVMWFTKRFNTSDAASGVDVPFAPGAYALLWAHGRPGELALGDRGACDGCRGRADADVWFGGAAPLDAPVGDGDGGGGGGGGGGAVRIWRKLATLDALDDAIDVKLSLPAAAGSWAAFGWHANGAEPPAGTNMLGADYHVLEFARGTPSMTDRTYDPAANAGKAVPLRDNNAAVGGTEDIVKFAATYEDGRTLLRFVKRLQTDDDAADNALAPGTHRCVWAFAAADTDNSLNYHGRAHRGALDVPLVAPLGAPPPPPPPPGYRTSINATVDYRLVTVELDGGGTALALNFTLDYPTLGWCGIGWAPIGTEQPADATMCNADFAILDRSSGNWSVADYWNAPGCPDDARRPLLDTAAGGTDDIRAFTVAQRDGHTLWSFVKLLDTADAAADNAIATGNTTLIVAHGRDDNATVLSRHATRHYSQFALPLVPGTPEPTPPPAPTTPPTPPPPAPKPGDVWDGSTRIQWRSVTVDGEPGIRVTLSYLGDAGWGGIGFHAPGAPTSGMNGADFVIFSQTGATAEDVEVTDRTFDRANDDDERKFEPPVLDTSIGGTDDLHATDYTFADGRTSFSFSRKLDTKDALADNVISQTESANLVWAHWNMARAPSRRLGYHFHNKGKVPLTLVDVGGSPPSPGDGDGMPVQQLVAIALGTLTACFCVVNIAYLSRRVRAHRAAGGRAGSMLIQVDESGSLSRDSAPFLSNVRGEAGAITRSVYDTA